MAFNVATAELRVLAAQAAIACGREIGLVVD